MGVYHLMGLGTSPGAVTAPLSYLTNRYKRWNNDDVLFFERSGEARQRTEREKVGDIQSLVFFTTKEVLSGDLQPRNYIKNIKGSARQGTTGEQKPMKQVLSGLLAEMLPDITKRKVVDVFWCEIDRRSLQDAYTKIIRVVAALSGVGGQGKEMWVNLTGGNNVTNLALELAANLSGQIARLYYVQAQDEVDEKCVFYTTEDNYWVELPVMPLAIGRLREAILDLVENKPHTASEIYSKIYGEYWDLTRGIESEADLLERYLKPMRKQGLLTQTDSGFQIGSQWKLVQPYQALWHDAQKHGISIEQLARQEEWITREEMTF